MHSVVVLSWVLPEVTHFGHMDGLVTPPYLPGDGIISAERTSSQDSGAWD